MSSDRPRPSVAAVLFVVLPGLAVLFAVSAALGVAAMYEARTRYEDALARTYRAEVAVREARTAATVELALARTLPSGSPIRRRASASRRRAEAAAAAAVRGDPVAERLLRRQLASQRRARAALRPGTRARRALAEGLRSADDALAASVSHQRQARVRSRDVARDASRKAVLRSGVAAGLGLLASLGVLWLLLRSLHAPLAGLVRASERLAAGDRAARVDPGGPTELRRLGETFNTMAARLEARQADLQAALARAEQANAAKIRFLSRVSHELRTPLNAILGFSQLLEMEDLTGRQKESVAQVRAAGDHLLGLVNAVIEVAGIESGTPHLSKEPVDLRAAVEEVVTGAAGLADSHEVSVDVDLPAGAVVAHADPAAVRTVLGHLVTNGIKFNQKGGRVLITAERDEHRVRVAVEDSGRGIDGDQLDGLFVPFERLGAEEAGIDGLGVGLALSQRLAHDMDGDIAVASEVGEGTRFTLALPARAASG